MKQKAGRKDILFATGILFFIVVLCLLFYGGLKREGSMVKVTVDGQVYGSYALKQNQTIPILINERVSNILEISDGKARMKTADCPDQLCVHQSAISHTNEMIICLPNKVVAEIVGGKQGDIDSVV